MPPEIVIVFVLVVLLAVTMIALGVRLLNRRPLVLDSRIMLGALMLAFLPLVINGLMLAFRGDVSSQQTWPLVAPVLILPLLFWFLRRAFGRVTVFNITEESLYDALGRVLDEGGIAYDERRSQILLRGRDAVIKINVQGTMNTGTLAIVGNDTDVLAPRLLPRLRAAIAGERLSGRSVVGLVYLALGAAMLVADAGLIALLMNLR